MKTLINLLKSSLSCLAIVFVLCVFTGHSVKAQNTVTFNDKIEWKFEHKYMTKAEMEKIKNETDPNKRVIMLKILIKLPPDLRGKGYKFGTSQMDFTIWDKDKATPSIAVARHIPLSGSMVPGLDIGTATNSNTTVMEQAYWLARMLVGIPTNKPAMEYWPCGGGAFTNPSEFIYMGANGDNYDTVLAYPFYIGHATNVGSFYVDFTPCTQYGCVGDGVPPNVSENQFCPGIFNPSITFRSSTGGQLINGNPDPYNPGKTIGSTNWMMVYNTVAKGLGTDKNFVLIGSNDEGMLIRENTSHRFIMGGITLLMGPETHLAMMDSACPDADFPIAISSKSTTDLKSLVVQYSATMGSANGSLQA